MTALLRARPLALAGPACVAGVLLAATDRAWPAAAALCLGGWSVYSRSRIAPLVLVALLGGFAAGRRALLRAEVALATEPGARARAPPRSGAFDLLVERCEEDPFRERSRLEGRDRRGAGVLCVWPGRLPDGLAAGARVRASGRVFVPRAPGNPGERDGRAGLAQRGVSFLADLRSANNLVILRRARAGPAAVVLRMRVTAARRLAACLPADVAPLAAALLLGIRSGIEAPDRLRFERSGTMHLLAISGMHVLLLAGFVHGALRRMGLGPRSAAGATLALAVLYVPIAGGAAPIRRAVTVLVFYAFALVRGRPADAASSLGGAALTLALAQPLEVFRVGFWLSFAAAAGIVHLAPGWRNRWGRRHRLLARFPAVRADHPVRLRARAYFLGAFPVALAAWCATQAIVARAFGIVTPLAPLTNVVVAPLVGCALPLAALAATGASVAAPPLTAILRLLLHALDAAASLPGACLAVMPPGAAACGLWIGACALLRWGAARALPWMAAAVLISLRPAAPGPPGLFLLDVGDGQAALLRFQDGSAVLVDGGARGRPTLWRTVLNPALRAHGVRRLEAVVCTHGDADHWNALPELLASLPVGRLVVGPDPPDELIAAARRFGVGVEAAPSGRPIHAVGSTRLVSVSSPSDPSHSRNDASLALVFRARGRSVLLPADREERGLAALLRGGVPRCDVLVAPHHGARCGLAARFGRAVQPRWLFVSAARGFAHAPTLRAYGARRVLQTWKHGCLSILFTGESAMRIEMHRP